MRHKYRYQLLMKTIKKQLGIFLPALLSLALFGVVVLWFLPDDSPKEIDVIRHRQTLAGFVVFAAAFMVSGVMVFQGIIFEKARARMERKLSNLATTDPLTGILNRRHFWHTAGRELHRHQRYFRALALLVMNIDRLKRINDAFGHPAGDKVLRELAKQCKKNLRKSDIFGRINGKEFAVLLVETTAEAAVDVADRLRQQLASKPFIVDNGIPINVTVSIGVTQGRREDECVDDLIKRADAAMVEAKGKGRNRVETLS
jgi:diguanylate cyclase (GGDEF)-like protein